MGYLRVAHLAAVGGFAVALGCAPGRAEEPLTLVTTAERAPDSWDERVMASGVAEVIAAEPRDNCPGICTQLTLRTSHGETVVVDVPGGTLGSRARLVAGRLPPRVGERVEMERLDARMPGCGR